jgi:hypothetical protein
VGIAIMPGMPLPGYVHRSSLAQSLVPHSATQTRQTHDIGSEFGTVRPAGVRTALPPPDPGQRSEHPLGPVVWEPAAPQVRAAPPQVGVSLPAQSPAPAVESPAPVPAAGLAWYSPHPAASPGRSPATAAGQYGWLFEPDPEQPDDDPLPVVRLPEQSAAPRQPGAREGSAEPVPPPPPGYALTDPADHPDTPPSPPDTHKVAQSGAGPGEAGDEADQILPWDGPDDEQSPRAAAAGPAVATAKGAGRRRRALFVLLVISALVAAAAVLWAWRTQPQPQSAGAQAAQQPPPREAGGLILRPALERPAEAALRTWARRTSVPGEVLTYRRAAVTVTVLLSQLPGIGGPDAYRAYRRAGGPTTGPAMRYSPGPRGGMLHCAAADYRRTVCFWGNEREQGAADITGLGRSAAAQQLAQMRSAFEGR